jgi:hypothetical protein
MSGSALTLLQPPEKKKELDEFHWSQTSILFFSLERKEAKIQD